MAATKNEDLLEMKEQSYQNDPYLTRNTTVNAVKNSNQNGF